jgi:chromosome segregation ATPase
MAAATQDMPTPLVERMDSPLESSFSMEKLRAALPVDAVLSRSQSTYSVGGHGRASSGSASSVAQKSFRRTTSSASHRRRGSMAASLRSSMSAETGQSEAKFFAFLDMVANASREAVSLKELWSQMAAERRNFAAEREELREQIEEVSYELEIKQSDFHKYDSEVLEHKERARAISVELTTAISRLSAEKNKLSERDQHIDRLRQEIIGLQELGTSFRTQIDRLKAEYQSNETLLKSMQDDRDGAREDADRYQRGLQRVTQERTEITTRLEEVSIALETLRKEATISTERLRKYELDQDEKIHEINRLNEELRKSRSREDESSQEQLIMSEKFSQSTRDISKLKDTLRTVEAERDELTHIVDVKNREIKSTIARHDEVQTLLLEKTSTLDSLRRELSVLEDRLRSAELERDEKIEAFEYQREQHKHAAIARDELQNDLITAQGKVDAAKRQINLLTETAQKTEQTIIDTRLEVTTLNGTVKALERERLDWQRKNTTSNDQLVELKGRIVVLQNQIHEIGVEREGLRDEVRRGREELEEVTETITQEGTEQYEFELESLRNLLRETREQKEQAISARLQADRERDDAYARFEAKCRDLDRFQEETLAAMRESASACGAGKSSTTTTTKKSSSSRMSAGSSMQYTE